MLKTSSTKLAKPKTGGVGVGGDSKFRHNGRRKFDGSEIGDNEVNNEVDNEVEKKDQKISQSKKLSKSKK